MEKLQLRNNVEMPIEGFGVFQVPDPEVCKRAVLDAIETGYRLIDTAAIYGNERAVGAAIAEAIEKGLVKREELFVVTKLWVSDFSYEGAKKGIARCLERLGLKYIDLLLLHQPYGDVYGAWKAMEEAYQEKALRAIGVSNFGVGKFTEFCLLVNEKPMVNQVELHPFFAQDELLAVMKEWNAVPMAWGPLAEGKHGIFTHPVLKEIGDKYGKTPAQVALKWNTQRDVVILPKSVHKERMEQNIDLYDFELSAEDMEKIKTLDLGHSEIIDHNNPAIVKYIVGSKVPD